MKHFPKLIDFDHRVAGEYLHNMYPPNFFSFILDMGARGVVHPWHVPQMATANPETMIVAFEPDHPYDKEIAVKIRKHNLLNAIITDNAIGTGEEIEIPNRGRIQSKSLRQIFEEYSLDPSALWAFKCDIEGGEDCLYEDLESEKLLRQCDHMGFEFHHPGIKTHNYFTSGRNMLSMETWEDWLCKNFKETHHILETAHPMCESSGITTVVLIKKEIIQQNPDFFVSRVWSKINDK